MHFKTVLSEIQVIDIIAADPVEYLTRRIKGVSETAPALSDIGYSSLLIFKFAEGWCLVQPAFPAQFRIEMQ